MKCLGYEASKSWFAEFGIQVAGHNQLMFPQEQKTIVLVRPERSLPLNYFAESLIDWLPKEGNRFIWLSDWETYPLNQSCIVDRVRASYGENKPIIESPGFLFDVNNETENAVLTGLFFLAMAFDWSGYLVVKGHQDYVYIYDGFVQFSFSLDEKAKEVLDIAGRFNLEIHNEKGS